ncbi:MAG: hypothetical protein LBJ83_03650 [Oscillospiraceae bacterium]|jgi:hypothetical protein|nr:hypothetical protein [Oscillospiraceae bacterium]
MSNVLPTTLIFNSHNMPVQPLMNQSAQIMGTDCNLLLLYLYNSDPDELVAWETISWLNGLFQIGAKHRCPLLAVHSINKFQNICSIIKNYNVLNIVLYSTTLQEMESVLNLFPDIHLHVIYPDGMIRRRG